MIWLQYLLAFGLMTQPHPIVKVNARGVGIVRALPHEVGDSSYVPSIVAFLVPIPTISPTLTYGGAASGTFKMKPGAIAYFTTTGTYTITVNYPYTLTFVGMSAG